MKAKATSLMGAEAAVTAALADLEQHGCRLTQSRREIVCTLILQQRPITAAELYTQLRGSDHRVGLVTVYRTLELLAERGWVHRFTRDSRPNHEVEYRFCGPPHGPHHHHVLCTRCGRVESVPACHISVMEAGVEAASGFHLQRHVLEFYGLCPACQRLTDT